LLNAKAQNMQHAYTDVNALQIRYSSKYIYTPPVLDYSRQQQKRVQSRNHNSWGTLKENVYLMIKAGRLWCFRLRCTIET